MNEDDPALSTVSFLGSGQLIRHHGPSVCDGWPCCIHRPSRHGMRTWPLYLDQSGPMPLMWRICDHGVGHVDPDAVEWIRRTAFEILVDNDECDECCGGVCRRYGIPDAWRMMT